MKTWRNVCKEIKLISDEEKAEIDKSVAEEVAEIKKTMMKKNNFDELVTVSQTISLIKDASNAIKYSPLIDRLLHKSLIKLSNFDIRYSHYLEIVNIIINPEVEKSLRLHTTITLIRGIREVLAYKLDPLEKEEGAECIDDEFISEFVIEIERLLQDKDNREKYDRVYNTKHEDLLLQVVVILQSRSFNEATYQFLASCLFAIVILLQGGEKHE